MAVDGVVSCGLMQQRGRPTVHVTMLKGYSRDKIPQRIRNLDIVVDYVDELPEPLLQATVARYQSRNRPVQPGHQIRTDIGNGSVGFMIHHEGADYLITAAHLMTEWVRGKVIGQHTLADMNHIANLHTWINIYGYPFHIGGPGDMMSFKLQPHVPVTNKPMDRVGGTPTQLSTFKPTQVLEPDIGMQTVSFGRTTGIKYNEVVEVDTTVRLLGVGDKPQWTCGNVFLLKYTASMMGDSGGGIFCLDPPGVLGVCVHSRGGCNATDGLEYLGFGRYPTLTNNRETVVELTIGEKTILVNGQPRQIDIPPRIEEGRTLLELRGIGEALGARFDYEPKDAPVQKVYIYR